MRNAGPEEAQAGIKIAGRNQGWQGPILPFPEAALILEGEDEMEVVRDCWEAQILEVIFFSFSNVTIHSVRHSQYCFYHFSSLTYCSKKRTRIVIFNAQTCHGRMSCLL